MKLQQLKVFLAVAKYQNFTQAGNFLHITQSAVSAAIQALETEFEVKLFNRLGREIELTAAGKLLGQEAPKLLEQVDLLEAKLEQFHCIKQGDLKLGISHTIGNYWLPEFLCQFNQQYPEIQVKCNLAGCHVISEATIAGDFNLGLIAGAPPVEVAGKLKCSQVGSDLLRIVVGPTHPWFTTPTVTLSDLLQTQWVMQEQGSGIRNSFEQVLHNQGINLNQLNVVLEMNSSEMIKNAVEEGIGAAVVSELMIVRELQLNKLCIIHIEDLLPVCESTTQIYRPFYLVKHHDRIVSPAAQIFEQLLHRYTTRLERK
jgi:DNA-binding transcriptional LysR family regulator